MAAVACGGADEPGTDATTAAVAATTAATASTGSTGSVVATSGAVVPEGFGTIAARTVAADGTVCELCLWLADDDGLRSRGLMTVTDLGGNDGMAFVYAEPRTGAFTMRNTVMPLSIAFYGPDGAFMSSFDMEPCTAEPCPTYPTPEGFTVGIEVPQGTLDELGMTPGSVLELGAEGCAGAG